MKRLVIYLLFDGEGFADAGVLEALRGFRPHAEHLFVVSNGRLREESRLALAEVADTVWERENTGFDVGGYRAALDRLGADRVAGYDETLLVNYTFLGPVGSFADVFDRMDARDDLDFWGLTEHGPLTPDPYLHRGTMPAHLQSHWLAARARLTGSAAWRDYWAERGDIASYADSVRRHEAVFSGHFAALGFAGEAAFPAARFASPDADDAGTDTDSADAGAGRPVPVANAAMEAPLALLHAGCPIVKRRLAFHDPVDLDHRGVDAAAAFAEAVRLGLPRAVLEESAVRQGEPRAVATNLGWSREVPSIGGAEPRLASVAVPADAATSLGTALVAGLRVADAEGSLWRLLDADCIPDDVDVVRVRPARGERALARVPLDAFAAAAPASALATARADAREALGGPLVDVASLFADDPRLGAAFPPAPTLGLPTLGHAWAGRRAAASALAGLLGVVGALDSTTPLAPYAGVAAYRLDALRPLAFAVERAGGLAGIARHIAGGEAEACALLDLIAARAVMSTGRPVVEAAPRRILERRSLALAAKYAALASGLPDDPRTAHRTASLALRSPLSPARAGAWLMRRAPGAARAVRAGLARLADARAARARAASAPRAEAARLGDEPGDHERERPAPAE